METGSPHTEQGGKADSDSNVVRLPRDWLGPRDELIPFGGSQHEEPDSATVSSPPKADDFWSEGSATVQHAWCAPAVAESAPLDGAGDLASDVPPPRVRSRATSSVAVRRRNRLQAAAGVAVVAAAVVVGASVGSSDHHGTSAKLASESAAIGSGHGSKTGSGARGASNPARGTNRSQAFSLDHNVAAGVRREVQQARARARTQRAMKARAARVRSARARSAAVQPTPVAARSTAAASAQTPYVASTGGSDATPTYVAPSSSSSVSSDTSSGVSSNSSSGPSGAGAPFGPGHLG